jgi:hypothetical protein
MTHVMYGGGPACGGVILQDFTGVPLLVDRRNAPTVERMGKDVSVIEPQACGSGDRSLGTS